MVYWQYGYQATPYQEKPIQKKEQTKEDKIKENLHKDNAHLNYWNVPFYCKNLEQLDLKRRDRKKNPICSFTHEFNIKYENESCHIFWTF